MSGERFGNRLKWQQFDIRALLAGCSMQSDQVTISALAGHIKFKGSMCILHMYVCTVVFKKFAFHFSTRWGGGGGQ